MPRTLVALLALVIALAASVGPARSQEAQPFTLGPVTTKEVAPGVLEVHVTTSMGQAVQLAPEVLIPTTRLRFVGPLQFGGISEAGLLGSVYHVSLNRDPRFDQLSVRDDDGQLRIDGLPVEAMGANLDGPQQPYRADGKLRRYLLDPDGPQFMVLCYQKDPPSMAMDLQWRGFRPEVGSFPNPSLLLVVFEPCGLISGPGDLPDDPTFDFQFDGDPQQGQMLDWEPWIFQRLNRNPQWLRTRWACLPLPTVPGQSEVVFRVKTNSVTSLVGLFTQVNYATTPGVRLRGEANVTLLRDPADQP